MERTWLITGCSSGLGKGIAKAVLARGDRAALPGMRERGGGWICNVTSIGGVRGALGNGYYSAAKAALERASEALAQEVAAFGIRVMLVEPGAFRTGFYGHRLAEPSTHLAAYDPIGDRYRKGPGPLPANQPGDPDRGGQRIVETLLREDAPFRLFLGSDAVEAAQAAWEGRLRELQAWQGVSRQSDGGKGERP